MKFIYQPNNINLASTVKREDLRKEINIVPASVKFKS